ncbi:sigma 54-interacting transcriptional regulator [Desulfovibrio sp. TomC]|uniref:sigma 54-interacting transcriptional regulator n=1 Tax=Desulfovibrio sp. TomC TaxID=1562888 RepID=UPI000573E239|nr:sigma 54-interacting transcriptional regulator [Desulfovibrio sp. TomC]KHK02445.1 Nitrogen regulation protein NtrC [Desulfovibrio sp. TomC]
MNDHPLPQDDGPEPNLLAELPGWFTQREVIPLDDNLALVVCHETMHAIVALCRSVAEHPAPVLLTGETGVGKSLLCRFIHASRNPYAPFFSRMTAGLEADVLDKWIFGTTDGQPGGPAMVEEAGGGTLVIEEMGDLPVSIQRRLLRYWDGQASGEITGGPVQWIAATNLPLRALRPPQAMLPEFLDRFLRIHVPPLRERKQDIPALVAHFSRLAASRETSLQSLEVLANRLSRRAFHGNVRELQSVVSLEIGGGAACPPDEIG